MIVYIPYQELTLIDNRSYLWLPHFRMHINHICVDFICDENSVFTKVQISEETLLYCLFGPAWMDLGSGPDKFYCRRNGDKSATEKTWLREIRKILRKMS